jgi:GTP-binding protein LepA
MSVILSLSINSDVIVRINSEDEFVTISNPANWPEGQVKITEEPIILGTIVVPKEYMGAVMKLCQVRTLV